MCGECGEGVRIRGQNIKNLSTYVRRWTDVGNNRIYCPNVFTTTTRGMVYTNIYIAQNIQSRNSTG